MRVQILTNTEHFDFVLSVVQKYEPGHDIYISTQPYVIISEYDVGVSFMHQYRVLPEHVNTHTWFNFHPAPLPEYKGRNLCYHAIMNGDKVFGATLHYMDENFDTGEIVDVRLFSIFDDDTAESLSKKAIEASKRQFQEYFPRILASEWFERHPNRGGTYYKKDNINDVVLPTSPDSYFAKKIRAVYYPPYYPKIRIGNQTYRIVKDD